MLYPTPVQVSSKKPPNLAHIGPGFPMRTVTIGGKYNIASFVDEFSLFTMLCLLLGTYQKRNFKRNEYVAASNTDLVSLSMRINNKKQYAKGKNIYNDILDRTWNKISAGCSILTSAKWNHGKGRI